MATHLNTRETQTARTHRPCRIKGCQALQNRDHFCCPAHWRHLPGYLRDAIWRAFREQGAFSNEYVQAAENAEAFLEDRNANDVGQLF